MKMDVNGHEAFAYTGGKPFDPALPCVVFVHGALHDHSAWTLLARWFAHHGHAVLAVDLPGHSQSEGPPLNSVEGTADWLWALLDQAGVKQASFVGHSMGSLIAMEAAARRPEAATALAMIGTAYPMKVSDALLATARDDPARAIAMVNAFSHSSLASKPSYPGPGAWLRGGGSALMHRLQTDADGNLFEHDFRVCDAYAGGLEAARRVTCPCHLIVGTRDAMTPSRSSNELAAALRAEVTRIVSGHALMQEAPDAVLNAMRLAVPA